MLRKGDLERTLSLKEKSTPAYLTYAQTLYSYLLSFFERALPLVDIQAKVSEEEEKFEELWKEGKVEGWDGEAESSSAAKPAAEGIWCKYCELSIISSPIGRGRTSSSAWCRSKELFQTNRV